MKTKTLLFVMLLGCLAGCSLFASPTATVKKFMSAAQKGDAEAMTQLFSSRAIKRDGIEKVREENQKLAKLTHDVTTHTNYEMTDFKESIDGNNARVGFLYQSADRTNSLRLVFALSKEAGNWKIDNTGGPELEDIADLASPKLKDPQVRKPEPIETPPQLDSSTAPVTASPAVPGNRPPISGGVLNNKAINLPQPAYPAVAKAARASGTVVVQVTVDENGDVISAQAVSGHPLLRAAAVAAARGAKFSPTKLSGQPVKVNGIINYQFTAE